MADEPNLPPAPPGYERQPQAAALPPPPPGYERVGEGPAPSLLESFGRGAAEGATFGFDDKLGLDKERRELSRRTNPWAHFLGELTGGVGPMALASLLPTGVGQAATAGRLAQMAGRGANLARAALVPGDIASTAGAIGQGAKLGASYGALSGAGHAGGEPDQSTAESLKARALGAVGGGTEGALFGAGLGGLGRMVFRGAQGLGTMASRAADETAPGGRGATVTAVKRLEWDRINPQEIMDQIRSEFPDATANAPGGIGRRYWGPSNARQPWTQQMVEEVVGQSMAGQGATDIATSLAQQLGGRGPTANSVQTILNELAQRHLGPLNIVDRTALLRTGSGENTQMGMRVAAASPGEATARAREDLLARQLGTNDRLHGLLDRIVGSTDYDGQAAAHQAAHEAAGNRLFALARQNEQPFNLNPILDTWQSNWANRTGPIAEGVKAALNDITTPSAGWQQAISGTLRLPGMPAVNAPTPAMQQAVRAAQKAADDADKAIVKWARAKANKGKTPPVDLQQAVTDAQQQLSQAQQVASQANIHPATPGAPTRAAPVGLNDFILARQGLTDKINGQYQQTPQGLELSQLGKTLAGLKTQLTNEVKRTNPDWALANDTFREGAAGNDALTAGANMSLRLNSGSRENLKEFTAAQVAERRATAELAQATASGDQAGITRWTAMRDGAVERQRLFRVGLSRAISDQIMNKGETEDLVKNMLKPGAQQILTQVLGPEAPRFIQGLQAEAAMLRTYRAQFGSQTAPLGQAIAEDNWAPRLNVSLHNPMSWIHAAGDLATEHMARTVNANRNAQLMQRYTDTNPLSQLRWLEQMRNLHRTRSNWGNLAGLPTVGSAAPLTEATVAGQNAPPAPPRGRQP